MKSFAPWTIIILITAPTHVVSREEPLRIESLEVEQSGRTLRSVNVQIRNVSSEPQSGIVWYVLAPPGEPEPWRVHAYASPERSIRLPSGRVATVELAAPREAPEGKFALSVWLHGVRPETGERVHSDMRSHDTPIVLAPAFSFSVDYIINEVDESDRNVLVRFSVRNNGERSARIGIDYRLTPLEEEPEPDLGQPARTTEIAAGVDYVVTVRHPEPLPRKRLKLTGWIYELVEGQLVYRGKDVTLIKPRD